MRSATRGGLVGLSLAAVVWCVVPGKTLAQIPRAPAAGDTLRVLATTPNGPTTGPVTQASIRFSQPMVALGAGDADRVTFVSLTPAVPVRYHWAETNVLVITPASGRFPFASTIDVRIAAGATATSGQRLAAPHVFQFSTPAPRLVYATVVFPTPSSPATPGLDLRLVFDQDVRAADIAAHVGAAIEAGSQALPQLSAEAPPPRRSR